MNYFNYFTEIEERFQQRRGSLLMLSTLDWALIETWREAGVPLEAVLRGIDAAFDKHDAQRLRSIRRPRQVNGLAWCAQAVLEAVEQSREASIGVGTAAASSHREDTATGFEAARIARYLQCNAAALLRAAANLAQPARTAVVETADRLTELATPLFSPVCPDSSSSGSEADPATSLPDGKESFLRDDNRSSPPNDDEAALRNGRKASCSHLGPHAANFMLHAADFEPALLNLESLDRTLSVLEEKLFAALLTAIPEAELVALREQAARELAPYRGKMQTVQIRQVQQQFLQKRLLEAHSLPRLSLFYMPHEDEAER